MPYMVAPRVSRLPTAGQGEWRLWERDCLEGDSSVLHCASSLRTIFASLARANGRVHIHNETNFPQAKLVSEINARFLLNEHWTFIFYCIIIVYILSSLTKKIRELSEGKKIEVEECTKQLLCDASYDLENNDSTNALRPLALNSTIFPHIL